MAQFRLCLLGGDKGSSVVRLGVKRRPATRGASMYELGWRQDQALAQAESSPTDGVPDFVFTVIPPVAVSKLNQ